MALVILPINWPSGVQNYANGSADLQAQLQGFDPPGGGPTIYQWPQAARAHRALMGRAAESGIKFRATSANDSFRPLSVQQAIFQNRYFRCNSGGKTCGGVMWCKRAGVAAAACPGTSNHGWGLAVDYAEEGPTSISGHAVNWLNANAPSFGISAELQSEPWHWRYVAGDAIPQAVLDFEAGNPYTPVVVPPAGPRILKLTRPFQRGEDVREAQHLLTQHGFGLGAIDGVFGPKTDAATKAFQRAKGLTVDGKIGPQTWGALRGGVAPAPTPAPAPSYPPFPGRIITQPPMMRGEDVRQWQAQMAARGWNITADGIYGPASERVARAFQAEKGLGVDGKVGPITWAAAWTAPVT